MKVGRLTLDWLHFLADLDLDLRPDLLPLSDFFFFPFEFDLRDYLRSDILFDLDRERLLLLLLDKRPFEMDELRDLRDIGVLIFSRVPLLLRSG